MIIPLIIPRINWEDYLKNTSTRGIDASPIKLSEYSKFIASLGEFRSNKTTEPFSVLRKAGDLLEHLQFSFLILGSKELFFRVMEITSLHVVFSTGQAIVSGTLKQWNSAIINCLDTTYSPTEEMRTVFNECLQFFDYCGLQTIFSNYSRIPLRDGTYLLEHKK